MKKKLLFSSLLLFLFGALNAQNPVPNPSFENWTAGEPNSWLTNNQAVVAVATTASAIAHVGSKSMRGEVIQTGPTACYAPEVASTVSGVGFSVTQLYGEMKFWYRFNSVSGDIITVGVAIFDGSSSAIGGGSTTVTATTSTWTENTIPVTYFGSGPVTCIITFSITDSGGGFNYHCGSYFLIDDVSMGNVIGIDEINASTFTVIQNPVTENILIERNLPSMPITLELLDCLGKKVFEKVIPAGEKQTTIDMANFFSGIYFVRLSNDKTQITRKVIFQH